MRELSASAFPLGETSLHLLHTPDGDMFVTADLAVKLFDSAPATFAEFVRANRYVRVNSMERAVVRLCASLGIPPETAGVDKPVSVPAGVAANDHARDARDGKTSSNASDAVTLLPEQSVLAILVDRREARRAAQFRDTAARRSFVAAERLVKSGDFKNALPLALESDLLPGDYELELRLEENTGTRTLRTGLRFTVRAGDVTELRADD